MLAHRNQTAAAARVGRRRRQDNDVVDGHMEGKDLQLLDNVGLRNSAVAEGGQLEDTPARRAHKQHVDGLAVGGGHACVYGHRGQPLVWRGADKVGQVDGRSHGPVHQHVVLDEVEVALGEVLGLLGGVTGAGSLAALLSQAARQPVAVRVGLHLHRDKYR